MRSSRSNCGAIEVQFGFGPAQAIVGVMVGGVGSGRGSRSAGTCHTAPTGLPCGRTDGCGTRFSAVPGPNTSVTAADQPQNPFAMSVSMKTIKMTPSDLHQ